MPTYCPTCGTSNPDDAKNCHYCDTSLARFASDGALAAGTLINYRYRITKLLKAGGMGAVYLAKDLKKNKIRAVKELFKQFSPQEEQYVVQRFKEEAEILSKLKHTNLPRVSDYFHDYDRYYLVMDYIEGEDLESILEQEGEPGLPELDVVDWAVQICEVLHYLHNQKPSILYRDTKPSNIMIRYEDGRAMLIDFGLARTIEGTEKGKTAIGTEGYSPPEQYMGHPEPRSDVYALGATTHHLLTGEFPSVPFQFSYVRDLNPDVSEALEAIVMKALEIEIDDRFPSAKKMQEMLLELYPEAYERLEYLASIDLDKEDSPDAEDEQDMIEIVEAGESSSQPLEKVSTAVLPLEVPITLTKDKDIPEIIPREKAKTPEVKKYELETPPQRAVKKIPAMLEVKPREEILYKEEVLYKEEENIFSSLIEKLGKVSIPEKKQIVEDLLELEDERAVPYLLELLHYREQELTRATIKALGKFKHPDSVFAVIDHLNSADPIIRQHSAVTLGEIKDQRALKPLIKSLAQGDVGTRASSAYALGNLENKEALEPLINAFIEDLDPEVRQYAAESIAQIEKDKNLTSLIEYAADNDINTRKEIALSHFSDFLIQTAGQTKKGFVPVIPDKFKYYIEMLASQDQSVRAEGISLLVNSKDPSVNSLMISLLEDHNPYIAMAAVDFLVETRNLASLDYLIELLLDPKAILRQKAAWALGELGDNRALKPLLNTLNHEDPGTRATAAYALGNMGDKRALNGLINIIIGDEDEETRQNAAESILQIESTRELTDIVNIALDNNKDKRKEAIMTYFPKSQLKGAINEDPRLMEKMKQYLLNLKSDNPRIRKDACIALGNMRIPEAVPYLCEILEDEDENICRAAAYALSRFPGAIEPIISRLNSNNSITVQMAVWALGEMKALQAISPLLELLERGEGIIKEGVASSLGKIGNKKAIEPLLKYLLDSLDKDVRFYAAEALINIETEKDLREILKVAKSDDKIMRQKIILQYFPIAERILQEMAQTEGFYIESNVMPETMDLQDENPEIRKETIKLLAEKYSNQAIPDILKMLKDPDVEVKDIAIIALTDINDTQIVNNIIDCLEDPSPVIQQRATWALGELKDKKAIPVLLELLTSTTSAVRICAAYALGNIEDERAVDKLCEAMLNDTEPEVRTYAAESLAQIKDRRATKAVLQALNKEQDEEVKKVIAKVFSQLRFQEDPFQL